MRKVAILRCMDGRIEAGEDTVAGELAVDVFAEGGKLCSAVISPDEIREFVYGRLAAEGLVSCREDVGGFNIAEAGGATRIEVELVDDPTAAREPGADRKMGMAGAITEIGMDELNGISDDIDRICGRPRNSGEYHYAFIFDMKGGYKLHSHDIGRHNAVDKAVGKLLLAGEESRDKILYVTSRINSSLTVKCIRAGLPVLVGRGAVTENAVNEAEENGLMLIGFFRDGRFNVYNAPGNIALKA